MASPEDPGLWHYFWSTLIDLLPVAVGGVIGYGGSWIHLRRAHDLAKQQEVSSKRRTQLQRLVEAAYEIETWSKRQERYHLFGGEESVETSPRAKIESISRLYLPRLRAEADELAQHILAYEAFLLAGRGKRLRYGDNVVPSDHIDEIGQYWSPVLKARDRLVESASREMDRLSN